MEVLNVAVNRTSPAPELGITDLLSWLDRVFFQAAEPLVIALKGGWGEGKTYFWKQIATPAHSQQRMLYASVFGAESIQEIRERVVTACLVTPPTMEPSGSESDGTASDRVKKAWRRLKQNLPEISDKIGLPSRFMTRVLEDQLLKAGMVVCLDDIERLSSSVSPDLLLGYVSELRDEHKLKVVLIFNDQKVSSVDAFRVYREKAIDREVVFRPSLDDVVRLALFQGTGIADNERLYERLKHWCGVLNLRNIRLLAKVRHYYSEILGLLPEEADSSFLERVLRALVLFVWIRFAREDDRLPTFDSLIDYSALAALTRPAREQSADAGRPEQEAGQLLRDYGYLFTDELDLVLMQLVRTDVLDRNALGDEFRKHAAESERERLEGILRSVWETQFHGTFKNNQEQFCRELISAARGCLASIPIEALDGSLDILAQLGYPQEAAALLSEFRGVRAAELVGVNRSRMVEGIRYGPLNELLVAAEQIANADQRDVGEVIDSALQSEFTAYRDRRRLAEFSPEEFSSYFLREDRVGLISQLRELCNIVDRRAGPDELDLRIQRAARKAAGEMAAMSRINGLRMERLGIAIAEAGEQ